MSLYFVTGNKNKYFEVKSIIDDVVQLPIDLQEIQETDARKVIEAKLKEAFKHHGGPFIIEDTSLYLDCLNGFPGPLIKWFLDSLKCEGIYNIADRLGNFGASAKTIIGYGENAHNFRYYEGELKGKIVRPMGDKGFGWDPIFVPECSDKSFAEMSADEKNGISMRRIAVNKLKRDLYGN
jgi:inosine triphosphate pyrophosphatase